jgi:hypothetical protein
MPVEKAVGKGTIVVTGPKAWDFYDRFAAIGPRY